MTDNPLLSSVQAHLQVLADQLEGAGDRRGATVRLMGQDLLAIVTEFERLQELEMVAGDFAQAWREDFDKPIQDRTATWAAHAQTMIATFFTPAAEG